MLSSRAIPALLGACCGVLAGVPLLLADTGAYGMPTPVVAVWSGSFALMMVVAWSYAALMPPGQRGY